MARFPGVALLFFSFFYQEGNSQHIVVPVKVQIPLLLKVVSLEKNISSYTDRYTIGVVFQNSYQRSQEVKDQILAMNGKRELLLLNGAPVRFISLELGSKKDIAHIFNNQRVDAVYITPLRSIDIKTLTDLTKSNNVLSMTGIPEYVDAGASVAIGIDGERPKVIVNLTASREEGVEFSSKVLNLVTIVH